MSTRATRTALVAIAILTAGACTTSTGHRSRPPGRTVELSCRDGSSTAEPAPDLGSRLIDGLVAEAPIDRLIGTRIADAGLRAPAARSLYFVKVPLHLRAGARTTTITLAAGSAGFLAWVPTRVWTRGEPVDLTRWLATTVVLHACPTSSSTYLGGLTSATPGVCLTLAISRPATPTRRVPVGRSSRC